MLAQRFGDVHFGFCEDVDELQGVHYAFALVVIVGDDEDGACLFADFLNARGPWGKFFGGI